MIVRFTEPDEFVDELAREPAAVARKIVRVTQKARPTQLGLTQVTVCASAKVLNTAFLVVDQANYDLVKLERYVGDLWGQRGADDEVRERAQALVADVTRRAVAAGFVVAAGEYVEDKA